MNITKDRLPSLNGLRAISILLVISYHLGVQYGFYARFKSIKLLEPILVFIQDGQLGVNVFFVISGFLITSILLKEETKSQTVSLKNFYLKRFLRIFPAYYTLLLFYFVLQLLGIIHLEKASWITSLTFTKNINWDLDWLTSHAWSLSIEEQFYLFWPLVFLIGKRFRNYFMIILFLSVPFMRYYAQNFDVPWMNNLTIFFRADAVAIGCLLAIYKEELDKFAYWKILAYFSLAFMLYFPYLYKVIDFLHLTNYWPPFGLTSGTFGNIFIGILVYYSVFKAKGIWFAVLNSRILNFIGLISFSLYLWQQFFIMNTTWHVNQFPFNLIYLFVVASCSYYFIEKPFIQLKDRLISKRK